MPLVVSTATYGTAMLAVLVSGLVSGGNARRKLARMDLVEVLKTRD
ncbi:MAG: hypothetical protein R3E96_11700 [Planctomycetota bacterium]